MKALSVIIVTYNSEPDIYECLEALFAHNDLDEALEVIVVDNNSSAYAHMLEEIQRLYDTRVTVLSNPRNGGYGQGNNIGIAHATAPVILIMNPDVRWQTGSFKAITEAYAADPNLALYGFKQQTMSGQRAVSFCYTNCCSGWKRSIGTFLMNRFDLYRPEQMCMAGACFSVRKEMFESIGGFDESIFLYGEENDIHYRLREHFPKSVMRYNPQILYRHRCENREFSETAYRQQIESNLYVCRKQKKDPRTYLINEEKNIRIVRRLKRLTGSTNTIPLLDRKLAIVRSYIQ